MKITHILVATAAVLSATTANAGTLVTPLGPSAGTGGGNVDVQCLLYNAGTKTIPSVTVTEIRMTTCTGTGTGYKCDTSSNPNATATCTDLAPGQICLTVDGNTALSQRFACLFTVDGSTKAVRAGMSIQDGNTGEALVYLPATGR